MRIRMNEENYKVNQLRYIADDFVQQWVYQNMEGLNLIDIYFNSISKLVIHLIPGARSQYPNPSTTANIFKGILIANIAPLSVMSLYERITMLYGYEVNPDIFNSLMVKIADGVARGVSEEDFLIEFYLYTRSYKKLPGARLMLKLGSKLSNSLGRYCRAFDNIRDIVHEAIFFSIGEGFNQYFYSVSIGKQVNISDVVYSSFYDKFGKLGKSKIVKK